MYSRRRLGVIAASIFISAGVLAGISAAPALAIPNHCGGSDPYSPYYGDVCANVAAIGGGKIYIHVWAWNYPFTGHFELQTPNHKTYNSANKRYYAGGAGPTWPLPDIYGKYCATAWQELSGGGYGEFGYVCFTAG
jgi:hypothetical protein